MTIIFECKTTQVGPIKTTIDCLNSLLTDVNFKFTPHFLEDHNDDSEYESEYIMVDFYLKYDYHEENEIYVFGAISNWDYKEKYKLKYNEKLKLYNTKLLLKQGYYNYQYKINNENEIEGNYFETKNEYTIYVYYKPIWARYEKIIGINKITSNYLD